MINIRFWCDECDREYDITQVDEELEHQEDVKLRVCPFCETKVTDFYDIPEE